MSNSNKSSVVDPEDGQKDNRWLNRTVAGAGITSAWRFLLRDDHRHPPWFSRCTRYPRSCAWYH